MTSFPDLSLLVEPRNIALVGASSRQGSPGRQLFDNLVRHSRLAGSVFPVNPACAQIDELPCWPSVEALPDTVIDVAVVIVSARHVLSTLQQCAARRIPFAIVLSSGFAEVGEEGARLEEDIADLCRTSGLRVYGPNCPGLVNVRDRLGLCFSPAYKDDLHSGSIGLVTQGGGLGRNLLQGLSHGEGVGLWFSSGNETDLQAADFIAYLAQDPRTRVIALLMEGIKDGRRLVAALALAQRHKKPVVVLKVGRSQAGVQAAQSHTASVSGSAAINSAVFRQFGAIEVDDLDQLVAAASMLSRPAPAPGAGLCILSFSGGAAALAADAAGVAQVPMAMFRPATLDALRAELPSFATLGNPVDLTADVLRTPEVLARCLDIVCMDPGVGAVLFPIPMDYGQTTADMAQAVADAASRTDKLIIPAWLSRRLGPGFTILEERGLLPFASTTAAIDTLAKCFMRQASEPQRPQACASTHADAEPAPPSLTTMLSEASAKQLLQSEGFPVPLRRLAHSAEEAERFADVIGCPVAMKIVSAQILHKTEVGGVRLGIASAEQAAQAYRDIWASAGSKAPQAQLDGVLVEQMAPAGRPEVLIGVRRDPSYGHVITFGIGGVLVEVLKDVVHRLLPLTPEEARRMVREIRLFDILRGVRGQPAADLAALEELLCQISDFVLQHAETLDELEFNPVWVGAEGQGVRVLDALLGFRAGSIEATAL
ncbi:acetate--CoA ligase family protein [Variovorax boronicumulans]|uniref:acetate--CoA ligase family protein n=1 Tax=Variovorax boronicumulans TaxID=436515 RepID=UPI001C55A75E